MTTFEAHIPPRRGLDIQKKLEFDLGADASVTNGREDLWRIVIPMTKGARKAVSDALEKVGGALLVDE